MRATCPVHGVQEFLRVESAGWWWCPQSFGECKAVIPDELVTPDGADVIEWDWRTFRRLRFGSAP